MFKSNKNKNVLTPSQVLSLLKQGEFNKIRSGYMTTNFKWGEFFHNCTNDDMLKAGFEHLRNGYVMALEMEQIRTKFGNLPVIVTSWFRSLAKHQAIYKNIYNVSWQEHYTPNSEHLNGKAVDFVIIGKLPATVFFELNGDWGGGLGKYFDFTHADSGAFRRWGN